MTEQPANKTKRPGFLKRFMNALSEGWKAVRQSRRLRRENAGNQAEAERLTQEQTAVLVQLGKALEAKELYKEFSDSAEKLAGLQADLADIEEKHGRQQKVVNEQDAEIERITKEAQPELDEAAKALKAAEKKTKKAASALKSEKKSVKHSQSLCRKIEKKLAAAEGDADPERKGQLGIELKQAQAELETCEEEQAAAQKSADAVLQEKEEAQAALDKVQAELDKQLQPHFDKRAEAEKEAASLNK